MTKIEDFDPRTQDGKNRYRTAPHPRLVGAGVFFGLWRRKTYLFGPK